ncbi:adhesion G protein-coupled receptor F5-like [Gigantopelta aegis]|uniref:adhesion G protein-coupled receptor F5-like n=1 Tax=Gigantopelta aegis TaxID=1735272 RepID=UPI001B887947|nr:adhesion G protein-coupled receptor F5-like [Gigantopelta aegis]
MYGYRVCFQTNISITNQLTSTRDLMHTITSHYPVINYRVIQLANITSYVLEMQNCPHKNMYTVVRYVMFIFSIRYMNRDQLERDLMNDKAIMINSSIHIRYQGGCKGSVSALKKGDGYHCSTQFHKFNFTYSFAISRNGVKIKTGAKYLQLNKQLSCPRVVLNTSHYSITYHDSTPSTKENKASTFPVLVLLKTRNILKDEDFQEMDNGIVIVCLRDYMDATFQMAVPCNNQRVVTQTIILGVLSFVCTSVSLFFLAMTFLTYCLFPSMRTIGGVCNMGLVATMFAAQSLFEFGVEQNEDVVGCQIIGIFIHFLWLAAVFWMNACTFLLFLKLSFPLKCRNVGRNLMKIFPLSALYANGASALIVCLNIIFNILSRGDIGYGGNMCYLNTMFSKIYFFKVPMGILIIINICLFTFTICRIRHHDSVSSTRESKINLFSCVKLSVLTGVVWLSSYLYEISHTIAFAYIFTVLVGAQGVLFFFAIVVNRKGLSLWNNCLANLTCYCFLKRKD